MGCVVDSVRQGIQVAVLIDHQKQEPDANVSVGQLASDDGNAQQSVNHNSRVDL
jgi:hypothetical protein